MTVYASRVGETYRVHVSDHIGDRPNPWGDFLRAEAKRHGWSLNKLAKESPVNRATLFRWLAGEAQPDLASVRAVADALGADMASALRAAGQLADDSPVDVGDWEIRMIRESGLHPQVIEQLIRNTEERRIRERDLRRTELAEQIALLRDIPNS